MSRYNHTLVWNSHRFTNQGRPLTKASFHQANENQTFGELANTSFTPSDKHKLLHQITAEEEWVALEREIFSTCLEPWKQSATSSIMESNDPRVLKPVNINKSQQARKFCQFCAKNGEIRNMVESHNLRHPESRIVLCPVLRRYKCELCGATGDDAHTKFYCPLNANRSSAPAAVLLKSTRNNATGRRT